MAGLRAFLIIATLSACLLGSCIADVRFVDPAIDGLFYLFMSGQVRPGAPGPHTDAS